MNVHERTRKSIGESRHLLRATFYDIERSGNTIRIAIFFAQIFPVCVFGLWHALWEFTEQNTCNHKLIKVTWMTSCQLTRVSLLDAAGSTICFLGMIWYWYHLLNSIFNMYLNDFQLHATKQEWKSALKRLRYYMALQKPKPMCVASKCQYYIPLAGNDFQVPWCGMDKWQVEQRYWYTNW